MNLQGWDTVSVVSVARLNAALEAGAERLISTFDYSQSGIAVRGRFGPWRILPGVAGAFLNVELPLQSAVASSLPGTAGDTDLSGVSVVVQMALKLLPGPDGRRRNLRFDLTGNGPGAQPVTCTEVRDPQGRLPDLARTLVGEAVAGAVAAHGDKVTYVFATVGGVEPGTGWLEPSASDWCYAETVGGASYLALLSVVNGSADGLPRVVDPAGLQPPPNALLALSHTELLAGAVLPYLQQSWFKGMKPRFAGDKIVSQSSMQLPTQEQWPFSATPYMDHLTMTIEDAAAVVKVEGHCDMSLGTSLDYTLTMTMPFVFDPATKSARFLPDKNPKETHTMHLPGVLDDLVGWLVRWILSFFTEQIAAPIREVAVGIQGMSSPPVSVIGWIGVPFNVTRGELAGALAFRDQ